MSPLSVAVSFLLLAGCCVYVQSSALKHASRQTSDTRFDKAQIYASQNNARVERLRPKRETIGENYELFQEALDAAPTDGLRQALALEFYQEWRENIGELGNYLRYYYIFSDKDKKAIDAIWKMLFPGFAKV